MHQTFQIAHGGKHWSGEWYVENGRVHVSSDFGTASRGVAGRANKPDVLAELMLRELVQAWEMRHRL